MFSPKDEVLVKKIFSFTIVFTQKVKGESLREKAFWGFLIISPNLHEIWVVFFLNLSQELKLVLLLYFGTLGDGYSLKGSKK